MLSVINCKSSCFIFYFFLQNPDSKMMQINLTGFLNGKNAREFMGELWPLLLSAQENIAGIPTAFLELKKEEIKQRQGLEERRLSFMPWDPYSCKKRKNMDILIFRRPPALNGASGGFHSQGWTSSLVLHAMHPWERKPPLAPLRVGGRRKIEQEKIASLKKQDDDRDKRDRSRSPRRRKSRSSSPRRRSSSPRRRSPSRRERKRSHSHSPRHKTKSPSPSPLFDKREPEVQEPETSLKVKEPSVQEATSSSDIVKVSKPDSAPDTKDASPEPNSRKMKEKERHRHRSRTRSKSKSKSRSPSHFRPRRRHRSRSSVALFLRSSADFLLPVSVSSPCGPEGSQGNTGTDSCGYRCRCPVSRLSATAVSGFTPPGSTSPHLDKADVWSDLSSESDSDADQTSGTQEMVNSLISAIIQTLELKEDEASSQDVSVAFKRIKRPSRVFPNHREFDNTTSTHWENPGLLQAVDSLLASGVVVLMPYRERFSGFYSNLFVVPKNEGSLRPILDLKQLNRHLRIRRFRMESLRSVVASMEPGEFLCSVDIRDAYLHVPICVRHQRFLRFAIQEHHYQFTALPFGLPSAPRVFTKVRAAVMAILRSKGILVIPYLDDLLIKGPSRRDGSQSLQLTLDVLLRLGWIINYQKSSLIPTRRLEFLGIEFDTSQSCIRTRWFFVWFLLSYQSRRRSSASLSGSSSSSSSSRSPPPPPKKQPKRISSSPPRKPRRSSPSASPPRRRFRQSPPPSPPQKRRSPSPQQLSRTRKTRGSISPARTSGFRWWRSGVRMSKVRIPCAHVKTQRAICAHSFHRLKTQNGGEAEISFTSPKTTQKGNIGVWYRHTKRRCIDTDNDPDRCSVAGELSHRQLSSDQRCRKKNKHYILTYRCLSSALCFSGLAVSTAAGKQSGDVTALLSGCPALTARAEKQSAEDRQR
ncbi:unnamed protein product [Ranitomeya imitator]|uniref:ribonuclease H n=1 Tax=Ranitomeya imitator TaxID=111125 RepID=A0ABN9LXZ2_9NEOB|nr:unnamed protein product [Ranitomeya imitator]